MAAHRGRPQVRQGEVMSKLELRIFLGISLGINIGFVLAFLLA